MPDGTPVIVGGGGLRGATVRVWRLADGTPLVPPLDLPESVAGVAVHGNVIISATGAHIAVHRPALRDPCAYIACRVGRRRTGNHTGRSAPLSYVIRYMGDMANA